MKKRMATLCIRLIAGAGLAGVAFAAPAVSGEIEPQLLQAMEGGGELPIIVRFTEQLDLDSFPGRGKGRGVEKAALLRSLRTQADSSQAGALQLLQVKGAKRLLQLWAINGLATTADPGLIEELAALPKVDRVTLDKTLAAPEPGLLAYAAPEWNLSMIGGPELWDAGYDGTGTVVATMDTGVDPNHQDLADSYRGGSNSWYDPHGQYPTTPHDNNGHGTGVMSLMVGGDRDGTSIGVAPGAEWIAVKIFNSAGYANESAIHLGFQWLLDPDNDPDTDDYPDVVNNSWGFYASAGQCYPEFDADIGRLKALGIAVVFAAGNEGGNGSVSPANNPSAFAVGSVDGTTAIAADSSVGPSACDGRVFPDVVAPGVEVKMAGLTYSAWPDRYVFDSGTSFAAPHVAGTMALLRQLDPDSSVAALEDAVRASGFDLGDHGADNVYGHGLVDAVEATAALGSPSCTTEIPFNGIDEDCNGYDLTIDIVKAEYVVSDGKLSVEATSDLGQSAALELAGYGAMRWDRKKSKWTISVSTANPGSVTVSGVEGQWTTSVNTITGTTGGGGKGKKK